MRPFVQLLRIAVQLTVALFVVGALLAHFKPQYTDYQNHDRIRADIEAPLQQIEHKHSNNLSFNLAGHRHTHDQFHERPQERPQECSQEPQSNNTSATFRTTSYSSPDASIKHFTIERPRPSTSQAPERSVLFLTLTRDENSWGRNPAEEPRTIYSFLDFITNTTLPGSVVSLGLLTSSESEFELYQRILTPTHDPSATEQFDYPFHRITLVLHTAATRSPLSSEVSSKADPPSDSGSDRNHRHEVAQHERRAILAKLRNYLQSVALRHESHLLWLDSDVYKFSSAEMVETMLALTTTTDAHEVGILTARCRMGEPDKADAWLREHPDFHIPLAPGNGEEEPEGRGREGGRYEAIAWGARAAGNYDLNAWRGRRTGPNNAELERLWTDLTSWEPHPFDGQTAMLDRVVDTEEAGPGDVVGLDSVGGTVLMIRADLVRMGLNFAAGYYVGMTFEHGEGYDGIETEGLCLLSRSFSRDGRSMCYTMGNPWSVWHTVF